MDRDLKWELTCPVCMELFSQPRRLGCGHSYCRKCLVSMERRPDRSVWNLIGYITFITCPECRRVVDLPPIGVDSLPPDFKLAKLVDVYRKMAKTYRQLTGDLMSDSDSQCSLPQSPDPTSNTHGEGESANPSSRSTDNVTDTASSEGVVTGDVTANDVTRNAEPNITPRSANNPIVDYSPVFRLRLRTFPRDNFMRPLSSTSSVDDVWRTTSDIDIYRVIQERLFPETHDPNPLPEYLRRIADAVRRDSRLPPDNWNYIESVGDRDSRFDVSDRMDVTGNTPGRDSRFDVGDRVDVNRDTPGRDSRFDVSDRVDVNRDTPGRDSRFDVSDRVDVNRDTPGRDSRFDVSDMEDVNRDIPAEGYRLNVGASVDVNGDIPDRDSRLNVGVSVNLNGDIPGGGYSLNMSDREDVNRDTSGEEYGTASGSDRQNESDRADVNRNTPGGGYRLNEDDRANVNRNTPGGGCRLNEDDRANVNRNTPGGGCRLNEDDRANVNRNTPGGGYRLNEGDRANVNRNTPGGGNIYGETDRLNVGDRVDVSRNSRGENHIMNVCDRSDLNTNISGEGYSTAGGADRETQAEGYDRAEGFLLAGSSLLDDIKDLIAMGDEILNEADEILDSVLEMRSTTGGDRADYISQLEAARARRLSSLRQRGIRTTPRDVINSPRDVRSPSIDVRSPRSDVRSPSSDVMLTDFDVRATTSFGDVRATTSGRAANNVVTEPIGFSRRVFRRTLDPSTTRTLQDRADGGYIILNRAEWDRPVRDVESGVGTAVPTTRQEGAEFSDGHRTRMAVIARRIMNSMGVPWSDDTLAGLRRERLCGTVVEYDEEATVTNSNAHPASPREHISPGMQSCPADGTQNSYVGPAGSEGVESGGRVTAASGHLDGSPDCTADNSPPAHTGLNYDHTGLVFDSHRDRQIELDREASVLTQHQDSVRFAVDRTPGIYGDTAGQHTSDEDSDLTTQADRMPSLENRKSDHYKHCLSGVRGGISPGCIDQKDIAFNVSLEDASSDESERQSDRSGQVESAVGFANVAETRCRITGFGNSMVTNGVGTQLTETRVLSDDASRPKCFDEIRCSPDVYVGSGDSAMGMGVLTEAVVSEVNDVVNTPTHGEETSSRKHDGELYGAEDTTNENSVKTLISDIPTAEAGRTAHESKKDRSGNTGSVTRYPNEGDVGSGSRERAITKSERTSIDVARRAWWSRADSETDDVKTYSRSRRRSPAKISVTVADDVMSNRTRRHSRTATRSASRNARSAGRGDTEQHVDEDKYAENNGGKTSRDSRRQTSRNRRSGSVAGTRNGDWVGDVKSKESCDIHGKYLSQDRDGGRINVIPDGSGRSRDRQYENKEYGTNEEMFHGDVRRRSSKSRQSGSSVRSRFSYSRAAADDDDDNDIISDADRQAKPNGSADHGYNPRDANLGNSVQTIPERNRPGSVTKSRTVGNRIHHADADVDADDVKYKRNRSHSSRGRRSDSGNRCGYYTRGTPNGVQLESAHKDRPHYKVVDSRCCGQVGGAARSTCYNEVTDNAILQTVKVERTPSRSRRNSSKSRRPASAVRPDTHENKTCNANVETFSDETVCSTDRRASVDVGEILSCSSGLESEYDTGDTRRLCRNPGEMLLVRSCLEFVSGYEESYSDDNRRLCNIVDNIPRGSDLNTRSVHKHKRNTTDGNSRASTGNNTLPDTVRSVDFDTRLYRDFDEVMSCFDEVRSCFEHKEITAYGICENSVRNTLLYNVSKSDIDRRSCSSVEVMSGSIDSESRSGYRMNRQTRDRHVQTGSDDRSGDIDDVRPPYNNRSGEIDGVRPDYNDRSGDIDDVRPPYNDRSGEIDGVRPDYIDRSCDGDGVRPDYIDRSGDGDGVRPDYNDRSSDGDGVRPDYNNRSGDIDGIPYYNNRSSEIDGVMPHYKDRSGDGDGVKPDYNDISGDTDGVRPPYNDRPGDMPEIDGIRPDYNIKSGDGDGVRPHYDDVETVDGSGTHYHWQFGSSCYTRTRPQDTVDAEIFGAGLNDVESDTAADGGSVGESADTVTDTRTMSQDTDGSETFRARRKCVESDRAAVYESVGENVETIRDEIEPGQSGDVTSRENQADQNSDDGVKTTSADAITDTACG